MSSYCIDSIQRSDLTRIHLRGSRYDFVSERDSVLHRHELTKRTVVLALQLAWFIVRVRSWSKHVWYWHVIRSLYDPIKGTDYNTATITVLLSTRLALFGDNAFLWAPRAVTGQSRSLLDSSTVTVPQLLNRSPLFMRICGILISGWSPRFAVSRIKPLTIRQYAVAFLARNKCN